MKFAAIIDIAAFIWDEEDFKVDQSKFYSLIDSIPKLLDIIVKERIPVVFRSELFYEIRTFFPYGTIPLEFQDFTNATFRFLTKINMLEYQGIVHELNCNSVFIRDYFKESTKQELNHLINYIYHDNYTIQKLLTFRVLWQEQENMSIRNGIDNKVIETHVCDDFNHHPIIINGLKKIFEHNPKHRKVKRYYKGKVISPLRCYDPRHPDTTKAQELLDAAFCVDTIYYNYDEEHGVYIRFLNTEKNKFHGFEENLNIGLKAIVNKALKNE